MEHTFNAPYIGDLKKMLRENYEKDLWNSVIIGMVRSYDSFIAGARGEILAKQDLSPEQKNELIQRLEQYPNSLHASGALLWGPKFPGAGDSFVMDLVLRGEDGGHYVVGSYYFYCDENREITVVSPGWASLPHLQMRRVTQDMEKGVSSNISPVREDVFSGTGDFLSEIGESMKKMGAGMIRHASVTHNFVPDNLMGATSGLEARNPGVGIGIGRKTGKRPDGGAPFHVPTSPFGSSFQDLAPSSSHTRGQSEGGMTDRHIKEMLSRDPERSNYSWYSQLQMGGVETRKKYDIMMNEIAIPIYRAMKERSPSTPTKAIWKAIERECLKRETLTSYCTEFKKVVDVNDSHQCIYMNDCGKFQGSKRAGCLLHNITVTK